MPHEDVPLQSFPVTQWSLVDRARQPDETVRREALSVLLQRYLPALRAHLVAGKSLAPERADDLLQGFVADKIIEQNLLTHAAQDKGKFRSFLLVTLDRYVISQHRSEHAAKRCPDGGVAELGEDAGDLEGGDNPAEQFNVTWARELIAEALRRMQAECADSKRPDLWTIFHGRVLRPAFEAQPPLDYTQLVEQLGLTTPLEACALLTTAKRMFLRNLRAVAGEYSGDAGDAEAEIADLRGIIGRCGAVTLQA